jgi:predicted TIM-barrel fold metal-dependent hydrolase
MPDIEASLREIAYSFDQLKADGVIVYSNNGDRWIGDKSFDAIHAELSRRRAFVFVHPQSASCCRNLVPGVPDPVVEFGTDTTRAIAGLIFGGATTRYPDIKFIFAHGGGTMPYLIERFLGGSQAEIVPGIVTRGQAPPYTPVQPAAGVLAELRRMYYDTAQCSNPVAMRALRTVVPTSNILFGTDYFYRTTAETAAALVACRAFDATELAAVFHGNSARLWPHLA